MRIAIFLLCFFLAQTSFAVFQDAEISCPGCHGVLINGAQAVGTGGGRNCAQRSEADWITTIDRMNAKGCGAENVFGIANYLANFDSSVTTPTTLTTSTTTTTTESTTITTTTTTTLFPTATIPSSSQSDVLLIVGCSLMAALGLLIGKI